MSEGNFDPTTLGGRLEVGDIRGVIAHAHYGTHQDSWDSTLEADLANARFRRAATDLEVALLRHVGAIAADETRPITVANTFSGPIRRPVYAAGRERLRDPRTPIDPTPTTKDSTNDA